jgi:hypothetical protein
LEVFSLIQSKSFLYIQTDLNGAVKASNAYFSELYPAITNGRDIIRPEHHERIPVIEDCGRYDKPIQIEIDILYLSGWHHCTAFLSSYNKTDVDCVLFPNWDYKHLINHDLTRPVCNLIGLINLLDRKSVDAEVISSKLHQAVRELEAQINAMNRLQ